MPLYPLVNTAVVGLLGAVPLAGLSAGGIVLAQIDSQMTFLSFGTTARAARLHGAGRRADAVAEGVQATWLAAVAGLVITVVGQLLAAPVAGLLTGDGRVAAPPTRRCRPRCGSAGGWWGSGRDCRPSC
ncbi:MATE family efflux transporter [Microbispora bryophytorum]|uniref:MATE family efflux transporter n=1 Tax=Microbispora bryophytorum TaxID=1460882 RepID=UPI0033E375A4